MTTKTKTSIAVAGVAAAVMVGASLLPEQAEIPTVEYQHLEWQKPTTDEEWAEDVKAEQLNYRLDYQLQEMKESHEAKLLREKTLYDKATLYPDAIRWELVEAGIPEEQLDTHLVEQIANIKWGYEKLQQSVERINKEIELRSEKRVDRKKDILTITPSTEKEWAELQHLK